MINILKKLNSRIKLMVILFLVIFLISIVLTGMFWHNQKTSNENILVTIAGQELKVKIASTTAQKELGLGRLSKLPANEGMLFIYSKDLIPVYWMKDMLIPIDIIWLKDDVVMGYEQNLLPQTNNIDLKLYQPLIPVNAVLEVNAGFVDKYSLKIGDSMKKVFK